MSSNRKIVVLPGDGIGPEIIEQAQRVLQLVNDSFALNLSTQSCLFGGAAYDATGKPLPDDTLAACREADAILLGAIGGPKYDTAPRDLRPERGLLSLRSELKLFANLRPAMLYPELAAASSLKAELVAGLDLMILRELTGGIYFGQPRGIEERDGERVGFNTMVYKESEIRRIGIRAFEIARQRGSRLCSVDKMNVLEVSELWREIMGKGMYEPIHGSAPDIAGQGVANPLATILSVAMMLRYTLNEAEAADAIDAAVSAVIRDGYRCADIKADAPGEKSVNTSQMGDAVMAALQARA